MTRNRKFALAAGAVLLVVIGGIAIARANGHGPCHRPWGVERHWSADQVRTVLAGGLVWRGDTKLKVGNVQETGELRYRAEILAEDGSVVRVLTIDGKSGRIRRGS